MDGGKRSHALGDECRDRANKDERQFVNWIAVASGAGIGLLISFATADHHGYVHLSPTALVPALAAWIAAIMLAGVALYGMVREQTSAANMFHAIGRRERQKEKLGSLLGSEALTTAAALAKAFHEEADRHHRRSRRWLVCRETALALAVALFVFGALWAAGEMIAGLAPAR